MDDCITTSIFDIFKTGPGPSSSHTIGPMKAALLFREAMAGLGIEDPVSDLTVSVHLYGSLSLTGRGHGTHKAVLGGLMGWEPETCDCDRICALLEDPEQIYEIPFRGGHIRFLQDHIRFEDGDTAGFPFANTMQCRLTRDDTLLLEREYYSVGGGFVQSKGEIAEKRKTPASPVPRWDARERSGWPPPWRRPS